MKALVKARPERGLWLQDVPEPQVGINDVLIKIHKTGICGTDLHIYKWDAWAQKTIPVPMVVGHEFVGEVVSVGSNVNDFHPGERTRRVWALPQLPRGTSPSLQGHRRDRSQSHGRIRGVHQRADDECLASQQGRG
jgi:threonine dehydrogenase-like Zn-dependent dehydrogenase